MTIDRKVHFVLFISGLVWLALIFAAPWATHRGWLLGSFLYELFRPLCHQLPQRSFSWHQEPLAVCCRCLGIYVGLWLVTLSPQGLRRLGSLLIRHPRALLLFLAPTVVDFLLPNTGLSRFLTGMVAGTPLGGLLFVGFVQFFKSRQKYLHEVYS